MRLGVQMALRTHLESIHSFRSRHLENFSLHFSFRKPCPHMRKPTSPPTRFLDICSHEPSVCRRWNEVRLGVQAALRTHLEGINSFRPRHLENFSLHFSSRKPCPHMRETVSPPARFRDIGTICGRAWKHSQEAPTIYAHLTFRFLRCVLPSRMCSTDCFRTSHGRGICA